MADIETLRAHWTHLYRTHLPALAKSRDEVQKSWPVHLDHCFARIILDNAVGVDRPWTEVVKAPAVRNMSVEQLENAIELAERVATGQVELGELDGLSLGLRGKQKGKRKRKDEEDEVEGVKKKMVKSTGTISAYFLPSPASSKRQKTINHNTNDDTKDDEITDDSITTKPSKQPDMSPQLSRIATSTLTPFRKLTLSLLCQIPRGHYSTYQALANHISATSHTTCARAVGNAMRNNPFAPEVPCHRVLATGGGLGGFKGEWGLQGKWAGEKMRLLRGEGVGFDVKGRVLGQVWRGFEGIPGRSCS